MELLKNGKEMPKSTWVPHLVKVRLTAKQCEEELLGCVVVESALKYSQTTQNHRAVAANPNCIAIRVVAVSA